MQIFLTLLAGFVIGWKARELVAMRKIKSVIEAVESAEKAAEKKELRIKVERSNDVFYVFEDETDKFIVQGPSRDEIGKMLLKMHPDTLFVIDPDNVKEVDFK